MADHSRYRCLILDLKRGETLLEVVHEGALTVAESPRKWSFCSGAATGRPSCTSVRAVLDRQTGRLHSVLKRESGGRLQPRGPVSADEVLRLSEVPQGVAVEKVRLAPAATSVAGQPAEVSDQPGESAPATPPQVAPVAAPIVWTARPDPPAVPLAYKEGRINIHLPPDSAVVLPRAQSLFHGGQPRFEIGDRPSPDVRFADGPSDRQIGRYR